MSKPIADKGQVCPLHKVDMSKVCHKCPWFILVRGSDPQTGQEVDTWGCSIAWLPTLLLENAKHTRHTGAAVESFRNEMVKTADQRALQMLAQSANSKLISAG